MKTEFTLKADGWYVKLMKFIWGLDHSDFPNMCPFFWLTLLNIVMIIPICIIKILIVLFTFIRRPFTKLFNKWDDYLREKQREEDEKINNLSEEEFEKFLKSFGYSQLKKFGIKHNLNDSKFRIYRHLRGLAHNHERVQKEERKQVVTKKMKAMKNLWIAKIIGKMLIIISIILALLLLTKFVMFLCTLKVDIDGLIIVLKAFGWGVPITAVVILLYKAFKYVFSLIGFHGRDVFGSIGNGVLNGFTWIGKGFKTIGQIIYTLYKGNCPGITWKTEK